MKTKVSLFNPITTATKTIIRAYRFPLLLISILMGILIFVMNVFLTGALCGNSFNTQMKDKLWVYIYLNATANEKQTAIALKSALEAKGLKVDYASKQEALKFVEKRVPDLTTTLKKYNLENPLPSTLYIRYGSQTEFNMMKNILEKNKDQIMNMDDLSDNAIKTQEKRVLNVINLSNFLQSFAYLVVGALVIIIIAFAIFFLRTIFSYFINDIQAKKLIGATAHQIIQPFLNVIFIALVVAFLWALLLTIGTLIPLDTYLSALFNFNIFSYLTSIGLDILAIGILEIWIIMLLLMAISYRFILRLHRKLK